MKLYERLKRFYATYHEFIVAAREGPFISCVFLMNNAVKHRVH